MRLEWFEAAGIFILWLIQFLQPHLREEILVVYGIWIAFEIFLYLIKKKKPLAFTFLFQSLQKV